MHNCEPLFTLYRGEDKRQRFDLRLSDDSPFVLTGSFLTARLFARGMAKPAIVLTTQDGTAVVEGEDGNIVALDFSRGKTALLAPGVYSLEVLRDPDNTGNEERHPVIVSCSVKVIGLGAC